MAGRSRRKLVVVANRGPYRSVSSGARRRWVRSAGGLVTALEPVLRARGGVWVSAEEAEEHTFVQVDGPNIDYDLVPVKISRSDNRGFYLGVSNALLWPLLHSFPPTIRIAEAPWHNYLAANRAFADVVGGVSGQNDLVWVHDYHLMLVPGMVRERQPKARIGWFCHVPWPNPDLFAILPARRSILDGLLGADLIGFHTRHFAHNFLACVEQLTRAAVDRRRMTVRTESGRTVRVIAAPIGIAVDEVRAVAADAEVMAEAERLKARVNGRRIVLGVDRLDYTKGIPERMLAYERFLKGDKSARERYVLVQVMVPSRTDVRAYAQLKAEVDRLVGDINGRYGATGQVPIHYLYRSLDQRALYAHYRAADVALVTPLRDGMNLVAQEYVASRLEGDGVLVLSEFAGAASYLDEAMLVNPYDIVQMRDALKHALAMRPRDMTHRMRSMQAEVEKLDVHRWADDYLKALEENGG